MSEERILNFNNFYLPPTGGPLYWRDEVTGVLSSAIWNFINSNASTGADVMPTARQLKIVQEYLEYYIHAPCWDIPDNAFADELEELRQSSKRMRTEKEIHDWIFRALEIGIDPL